MTDAPCKNCERRGLNGCGVYHDKCEPFQTWKKESAEEAERLREAKIQEFHKKRRYGWRYRNDK